MDFFKIDDKVEQINGLTNQLEAIFSVQLFLKEKKSILYIAPTLYDANIIYQMISDFTDDVLLFPMDNFLTNIALASSPELLATRLATLNSLLDGKEKIVVTNLMGYLRYLPTKETFTSSHLCFKKNKDYKIKEVCEKLVELGYKEEDFVSKSGEFAKRGFVLDIFPLDLPVPYRIEFWGDTIDSIKTFDVDTQRTISPCDSVEVSPFFEKEEDKAHLYDYFNDVVVVCSEYLNTIELYKKTKEEISEYNASINEKKEYMHDFYLPKDKRVIYLEKNDTKISGVKNTQNYLSFTLEHFSKNSEELKKQLNSYIKDNKTVVICLKSKYQLQKIEDLMKDVVYTTIDDIYENKINLVKTPMKEGFVFLNKIFITEKELFYEASSYKYKSNFKLGSRIKDIDKLNIGDYIVHMVHGIGRYQGLKTLVKNDIKKDYLMIEYKGGDKLYIPVEKIDLISKYSSNEAIVPKLHKLGGTEWQKTKLQVRKKLENIAGSLLELYALREASEGIRFLKDSEEQAIFESEFPYEETKDQLRVIEEIKLDMEKKRPMDRLVCGDVGYGKTELAFRAMFKAVFSGYQVAYLCPTTILSNQHFQNALVRFQSFPITIKLLNRFVSSKEVKKTIEGLKNGTVDIVIGTHRLLSDDIEFRKLGLLIVDEEQRFGVKHKEKMKKLKNNIDILTLSATPIPRTLQMSMTGIRDMSLLETPPNNRYPIQTYVLQENPAIIKDAIYKELNRNGQIYILYNSVENMEVKKQIISSLVPEARIICAHGQMSKGELEDVMNEFIQHNYDILLCTTIIETGIDIANVNTLLIMDADRFGLAQLYQIRGRVGRSDKIAYCYLMYEQGKVLSEIANKRLQVIKEFTELGSGFSIAARDLSIRGAGDILGSEQAGFIDSVGIELYTKLLNDEVNRLKGVEIEEEKEEQPLVDVSTSIDNEYVESEDIKIFIHQKISSIDSITSLERVKEEIEDRFGKVPEDLIIYMQEEYFEKLAKSLGITQIRQTKNFIEIYMPEELKQKIDGEKLFLDILSLDKAFRFGKRGRNMYIILDTVKLDKHFIYYLIDLMQVILKDKKN